MTLTKESASVGPWTNCSLTQHEPVMVFGHSSLHKGNIK